MKHIIYTYEWIENNQSLLLDFFKSEFPLQYQILNRKTTLHFFKYEMWPIGIYITTKPIEKHLLDLVNFNYVWPNGRPKTGLNWGSSSFHEASKRDYNIKPTDKIPLHALFITDDKQMEDTGWGEIKFTENFLQYLIPTIRDQQIQNLI